MRELEKCFLCGNPQIETYIKPDGRWWCGCKRCAVSGLQFAAGKTRPEVENKFVKLNMKAGGSYVG